MNERILLIVHFANNEPKTYLHLFIECQTVKPIWDDSIKIINQKINKVVNFSIFERMFGYEKDIFLTYLLISCLNTTFIYANFKLKYPIFRVSELTLTINKDREYRIAKKKKQPALAL